MGGLLILVRENRDWRAWAVLVPAILLTAVVWPLIRSWMPPRLLSVFCFGAVNQTDFAFRWLVGGWTALWLAAPWLVRLRPAVAFAAALTCWLAFGTAAHAMAFSAARSVFTTGVWWRYMYPALVWFATCAVGLMVGTTLGAARCRSECRPRRFLMGMAGGMLAVALVGTALYLAPFYLRNMDRMSLAFLLLAATGTTLGVAAFMFVVNLPFLYLARRWPLYRERFRHIFRLPDAT